MKNFMMPAHSTQRKISHEDMTPVKSDFVSESVRIGGGYLDSPDVYPAQIETKSFSSDGSNPVALQTGLA